MISKFEQLDNAILSVIDSGKTKFNDIFCATCPKSGVRIDELCLEHSFPEVWRALDRRLQAMRKKGIIVFMNGWRRIPAK